MASTAKLKLNISRREESRLKITRNEYKKVSIKILASDYYQFSLPTVPPVNLILVGSNEKLTATVDPIADPLFAGFNFYIDGVLQNLTPQAENEFIFLGLVNGQNYTVSVTSVSTYGLETESIQSVGAPVDDLAPAPVTNLQSVSSENETLQISWVDSVSPDFDSVDIYLDDVFVINILAGVQTYTYAGLINGQTYKAGVVAKDGAGNASDQVFINETIADTLAPAIPTGLALSPVNEGLDATWDANTEPDLAGYNIYVDSVKDNISTILTEAYSITGLTNGVSSDVEITAVDSSGNESAKSAIVSGTPQDSVNPDGTYVFTKDSDALILFEDDTNTLITSFSLGVSTVDGRTLAMNANSDVLVGRSTRPISLLSFNGTSFVEEWTVSPISNEGESAHKICFNDDNTAIYHTRDNSGNNVGTLVKRNYATGAVLWATNPNLSNFPINVSSRYRGYVATGPSGALFFAIDDANLSLAKSRLYKVDPSDGSQIWNVNLGGAGNAVLDIASLPDGGVVVLTGGTFDFVMDGHVHYRGNRLRKYDSAGTLIWDITVPNSTGYRKVETDRSNNVYIGGKKDGSSAQYTITKMDAGDAVTDPAQQWTFTDTNDGYIWSMCSDGVDSIFIGTGSGVLRQLSLSTGAVLYTADRDNSAGENIHAVAVHPSNPAFYP